MKMCVDTLKTIFKRPLPGIYPLHLLHNLKIKVWLVFYPLQIIGHGEFLAINVEK